MNPPDADATAAYDYGLPAELIAQRPIEPRDASRLLVLDRASGAVAHRGFTDLPAYLAAGDVLVINDTRVLPARLIGRRVPSGGRAELLLLQERAPDVWEALVRPGRRLMPGARIAFSLANGAEEGLVAEIVDRTEEGRVLRFDPPGRLEQVLAQIGQVPLPPYIKEPLADPERYQTVYAATPGSAAAPTAGLHFTPRLLELIRARGVDVVTITLHVGLGTFRPIQTDRVSAHRMHAEAYAVSEDAARRLLQARARGARIVAVGTTVVRTLETIGARTDGVITPGTGWTDLFIRPGHRFCLVDALVTNFHLPRSSLLVLVCAFAGRERVLAAYREAVAHRYRFFSFGDAMLII